MSDSTIYKRDIRLSINPDNGYVSLQFGPVSMQGFCHAVFSLSPQNKKLRVVGSRAIEVSQHTVADVNGTGTLVAARFADQEHDLGLQLEIVVYDNQPFVALRVGLMNHGVEKINIATLTPFESVYVDFSDQPLDGWVNGFHSWSYSGAVSHKAVQPRSAARVVAAPQILNPTTKHPTHPGSYVGEWVAALVEPQVQAIVAGFIGVENQLGQVYLNGRPGTKSIMLQNTLDDIPIISGELIWGEWAVMYRAKLPGHDTLEPYAEAVSRLTQARIPAVPPSAGWSTWYQYFSGVTEQDLEVNQEHLVSIRKQLPLEIIQLDDGYQASWGDWLQHNARFPAGIQAWARSVRADGFEPGLWLSPFITDRSSAIFQTQQGAVLKNSRGKLVPGGFLPKRRLYGLDTTHPAVRDYIAQIIETIVHRWEIKYLKLDYLYAAALPGIRYDPTQTRAQALRSGLSVIREVAGDDVILLGCGCPLGPALGLVDIMRVSADTAPYWYPKTFGVSGKSRSDFSLPACRNSLAGSTHRHWTHSRWWWLDADNVLTRTLQKLTLEEVRTAISITGILGSHIMLSDALDTLPEQSIQMAAALLPYVPGVAEIPSFVEAVTPSKYLKRYDGATGMHVTAALVNWLDKPASVAIGRDEIGLPAGIPVLIYDFWNQRAMLSNADVFDTGILDPHETMLLSFRPITSGPQLVGTGFHISMGGEITDWHISEKTLSFTIQLGRYAAGTIVLKLPAPPTQVLSDGRTVPFARIEETDFYVLHMDVAYERQVVVKLV